ncbi:hypothetical protein LX36DRAFT_427647 [Colletotrichum falcatum]|nr:hypothetical protein LX36DRAFT_427647 [Colletotrichum falcatum]
MCRRSIHYNTLLRLPLHLAALAPPTTNERNITLVIDRLPLFNKHIPGPASIPHHHHHHHHHRRPRACVLRSTHAKVKLRAKVASVCGISKTNNTTRRPTHLSRPSIFSLSQSLGRSSYLRAVEEASLAAESHPG